MLTEHSCEELQVTPKMLAKAVEILHDKDLYGGLTSVAYISELDSEAKWEIVGELKRDSHVSEELLVELVRQVFFSDEPLRMKTLVDGLRDHKIQREIEELVT